MKKSFMFVSPVLNLTNPVHQLIIAEQEKAMRREEFEMARHRLMGATNRVQELKATIHFAGTAPEHCPEREAVEGPVEGKEACNG